MSIMNLSRLTGEDELKSSDGAECECDGVSGGMGMNWWYGWAAVKWKLPVKSMVMIATGWLSGRSEGENAATYTMELLRWWKSDRRVRAVATSAAAVKPGFCRGFKGFRSDWDTCQRTAGVDSLRPGQTRPIWR